MKRATMAIGVVVLAAATAVDAARGQGQGRGGGGRGGAPAWTTLACDVQADWTRSMNLLIRTAEAMPEDKWNFTTTEPQRTFGQHVMHIVQVDSKLLAGLGAKTPAPKIKHERHVESQHVYGQLVVYLRLNGVVPPASNPA